MTPEQFVYWLSGYIDGIELKKDIGEKSIQIILERIKTNLISTYDLCNEVE